MHLQRVLQLPKINQRWQRRLTIQRNNYKSTKCVIKYLSLCLYLTFLTTDFLCKSDIHTYLCAFNMFKLLEAAKLAEVTLSISRTSDGADGSFKYFLLFYFSVIVFEILVFLAMYTVVICKQYFLIKTMKTTNSLA